MSQRAVSTNVLPFPLTGPAKSRPYSLDVLSAAPVNGMVLIEACIPVPVLDALRIMLELGSY